jgi:hypothetical protein
MTTLSTSQIIGLIIFLGTLLGILFIFLSIIINKFRSKEHKWKFISPVILDNKVRQIKSCTKCNLSVHVPVHTMKELREAGMEEEC